MVQPVMNNGKYILAIIMAFTCSYVYCAFINLIYQPVFFSNPATPEASKLMFKRFRRTFMIIMVFLWLMIVFLMNLGLVLEVRCLIR